MEKWTGWRDIYIERELLGEVIVRDGEWQEEEYRYIKIPYGYGYDNYMLLVPERYVRVSVDRKWYFCVCSYETIELFYNPELREPGKQYDSYKMTGYELYERLFREYEELYLDDCEEWRNFLADPDEQKSKDKGVAICGIYYGDCYKCDDLDCLYFPVYSVFFRSDAGTYSNKEHKRLRKVHCVDEIMEMSKQEFIQLEGLMNAYISDFGLFLHIDRMLSDSSFESETSYTKGKLMGCVQWVQNEVLDSLKKRLEEIFNATFERFFTC